MCNQFLLMISGLLYRVSFVMEYYFQAQLQKQQLSYRMKHPTAFSLVCFFQECKLFHLINFEGVRPLRHAILGITTAASLQWFISINTIGRVGYRDFRTKTDKCLPTHRHAHLLSTSSRQLQILWHSSQLEALFDQKRSQANFRGILIIEQAGKRTQKHSAFLHLDLVNTKSGPGKNQSTSGI